jgi:hypothetical protein
MLSGLTPDVIVSLIKKNEPVMWSDMLSYGVWVFTAPNSAILTVHNATHVKGVLIAAAVIEVPHVIN